jgi:hypothetical protein
MNSTELRSFFYGTLLGDSYIHNGVFYCKQISKDLIDFKAKIIKKHFPNDKVKVSEHEAYIDKNGVHHQKWYELSLSKCEYVKKLEKLFYPQGKKIIPKNVINKLTPLGLALWYADDGTTVLVQYNKSTGGARSRRALLCTDCFTKEEHDNIILPELKELGFNVVVLKRGDVYRINFKDMQKVQKFFLTIGKYFYNYFPSLLYKMDLGYRSSSLKQRRYVLEDYENFYIKMSAHPLFLDRMKRKEDIVQTTTLKTMA